MEAPGMQGPCLSDSVTQDGGKVWAVSWNVQTSQLWPMGQLERAYKLSAANEPEQFSNFLMYILRIAWVF